MIPFGWSGCGQDKVILLGVRLTWCIIGTAEGTAVKRRRKNQKLLCYYRGTTKNSSLPKLLSPCLLATQLLHTRKNCFLKVWILTGNVWGTQDCNWCARGQGWLCLLLHCEQWQARQRNKEQDYLANHKYPCSLWFKLLIWRICSFFLKLQVGSPTSKLHDM